MKPTPAHYAYSRKVVQVIAPWLALGAGLESLGAAGMAVHNRPLGAATLIGAAVLWIGVWRMFAWRRAHPFEMVGADRETRFDAGVIAAVALLTLIGVAVTIASLMLYVSHKDAAFGVILIFMGSTLTVWGGVKLVRLAARLFRGAG